jgi:hypothetical protein
MSFHRQHVWLRCAALLAGLTAAFSLPVLGQGYSTDSAFTDAQLRLARADSALNDAQAALDNARARYQDAAGAAQLAQERAAADRRRLSDAQAAAASAARTAESAERSFADASRARDEQARRVADADAALDSIRERVLASLRRAPDYQSALSAELNAQKQFEIEIKARLLLLSGDLAYQRALADVATAARQLNAIQSAGLSQASIDFARRKLSEAQRRVAELERAALDGDVWVQQSRAILAAADVQLDAIAARLDAQASQDAGVQAAGELADNEHRSLSAAEAQLAQASSQRDAAQAEARRAQSVADAAAATSAQSDRDLASAQGALAQFAAAVDVASRNLDVAYNDQYAALAAREALVMGTSGGFFPGVSVVGVTAPVSPIPSPPPPTTAPAPAPAPAPPPAGSTNHGLGSKEASYTPPITRRRGDRDRRLPPQIRDEQRSTEAAARDQVQEVADERRAEFERDRGAGSRGNSQRESAPRDRNADRGPAQDAGNRDAAAPGESADSNPEGGTVARSGPPPPRSTRAEQAARQAEQAARQRDSDQRPAPQPQQPSPPPSRPAPQQQQQPQQRSDPPPPPPPPPRPAQPQQQAPPPQAQQSQPQQQSPPPQSQQQPQAPSQRRR